MEEKRRLSAPIVVLVAWLCISAGSPAADGCSSLTLVNYGYAVFGANYDSESRLGLLFINKRGLLKTGWTESTTGEVAQWTSRYASVTVNAATYQFPWAGMNERGLSFSTMALSGNVLPAPDERPPLEYGPIWMQYLLDTCATIEDVIVAGAEVRLVDTVDHYLLTDRTGASAVIEFIGGEMVVHSGEDLRVSALTNTRFEESVETWLRQRSLGNENCSGHGDSLERFCTVATRVEAFTSTTTADAVAYAFETLGIVDGRTPWSIVFDTRNLRAYFRTQPHEEIRHIDLRECDLRCREPAQMQDVHAQLWGNVTGAFSDYSHEAVFQHLVAYVNDYQGNEIPLEQLEELLLHLESFPCLGVDCRVPTGRLRPG